MRHAAVRFSTVGLPAASRLDLWENYNARALIGLRCTMDRDSPLTATELNLRLPTLQFAKVAAANAHRVERGPAEIAAHPADAAVLYIALAGTARFTDAGGERVLGPGDAVLQDADRPFTRGFTRGLTELVVKIPRPVYERISVGTARKTPHFLPRGTATLRALSAAVHTALGTPDADHGCTEDAALDLLGALVGGAAADGRAHLAAAHAFIDVHLRDHRLSAARIAAGVGISERQLSRVFSRDGTSIAQRVLQRRLDIAHAALTAAAGERVLVGDIARDCGFASPAHFARAVRQRFGATPAEVRDSA